MITIKGLGGRVEEVICVGIANYDPPYMLCATDSENPGNANLPIGDPRWHTRGYIPHFDNPSGLQHVTIHLADSLPKTVLDRLKQELRTVPEQKRDSESRKRIETWLDSGHGSCILRIPVIAGMTQRTLLHFDCVRYRMVAWVIMPNHVHVLFQPRNPWPLAKIVASWKMYTARQICEYRGSKAANLSVGHANQEIGVPRKPPPVWHREYWDRCIRDERHFSRVIEYIHYNPVKAGLVQSPEQWQWSSASIKPDPLVFDS